MKLPLIKNEIQCAGEVRSYYFTKPNPVLERPVFRSSEDASSYMRKLILPEVINYREMFFAVFLNRANRVNGWLKVSEGGMEGTVVDVRMVMKVGLDIGACSIILCHNHPSGNIKPSENDERITRSLKLAGDILNVKVIDHIILGESTYYSFADEGNIF